MGPADINLAPDTPAIAVSVPGAGVKQNATSNQETVETLQL